MLLDQFAKIVFWNFDELARWSPAPGLALCRLVDCFIRMSGDRVVTATNNTFTTSVQVQVYAEKSVSALLLNHTFSILLGMVTKICAKKKTKAILGRTRKMRWEKMRTRKLDQVQAAFTRRRAEGTMRNSDEARFALCR